MANKDRQKRSARQARARERAERVETLESESKTEAVQTKAKAERKPSVFGRIGGYFREVRSELKRVVWPSKSELKNYSVAIICALVVFGVAVWLVDTVFVALLVGFTGLRG